MDWVGVGTLAVVTIFAFSMYAGNDGRRWPVLALLLLSTLLQIWPPEGEPVSTPRHQQFEHARLVVLTLLTLVMVWLGINFTALIILYFVFSGRALFLFPTRLGYVWVLFWGALATGAMLVGEWPDWSMALLNGLGATCGFLFVGSAANAQRRAEEATAQLQAAHQQLQHYAASVEELAVAEERNRMAREMHDTLGHRLTVAAVQLEGAQKLVTRDPQKAETMIGTVRAQVLEGLTELRRTVAALRAPVDEELSLLRALKRLVTQFDEATAIGVELNLPPSVPPLSTAQHQTIYRTAQEALTNIQRHAQASAARITLTIDPTAADGPQKGVLSLLIEDNGIGLPAPVNGTHTHGGYGLQGLQERAAQLGGAFTVGAGTNDRGTAVQLTLTLAHTTDVTS